MSEAAQPHILVVDDDARIRALLQKFLARSGFMVTTARDAAHGRRLRPLRVEHGGLDAALGILRSVTPPAQVAWRLAL